MSTVRDYSHAPEGRFLVVGIRPWGDPVVLFGSDRRHQAEQQAERFRTGGLEGYTKIRVEDSGRCRKEVMA